MASVGFKIPGLNFLFKKLKVVFFFKLSLLKIGAITLLEGNPGGKVITGDVFAGKKVVLLGVPGG